MQKTWASSLGQEYPLKMGMATHFSILAWRIPGVWETRVHNVEKSQTQLKWLSMHADTSKMVKFIQRAQKMFKNAGLGTKPINLVVLFFLYNLQVNL